MKAQEIRKKSDEDLKKLIAELREQTRDLRFRIGRSEVKNHQSLRRARKDIAIILTIQKERYDQAKTRG